MSVFSTADELDRIKRIFSNYMLLPFSGESIPGAVMEAVLATVRNGNVLNTYDFVDVIAPMQRVGWQVKSTKAQTPVTWKRAKIPNSDVLIEESRQSAEGIQVLGDTIIDFCNSHALQSIELYGLTHIGYARLIVRDNRTVTYFERTLCTKENPQIFNPTEFSWKWSTPKTTVKKEQLPALHGTHIPSGKNWWAWHGLGENQLHFSGESAWWPSSTDVHTISFALPAESEKLSLESLMDILSGLNLSS